MFSYLSRVLLPPNNGLLRQFEDYVIECRCEKGRRNENTIRNKLKKICTKQEVNLRMRCVNGSPE